MTYKQSIAVRREEVSEVWRTRRTQACILAPYFISTKTALVLLYGTLTALGRADILTAYTMFLTIGLLQAFRLSCSLFIPFAFQHIAEIKVVLRRVQVNTASPPAIALDYFGLFISVYYIYRLYSGPTLKIIEGKYFCCRIFYCLRSPRFVQIQILQKNIN